jgi:twitching motility two-component system response regulator PilH
MSFFKRLWTTPKKDEPVQATVAESVLPPATGAVPQAVERRIRKRINARKGARALIIDDSPTIIAVLKKILRSSGYLTLEALDAERGMELIRQEKPDLVFLDIILPGMNGFGALRLIRKDPLTQHIPVIMISGNEHATEQFYANRIGADDFMKKPFSRFEVFARIENLLDADRMPRRKTQVVNEVDAAPTPAPTAVAVAAPVSVAAASAPVPTIAPALVATPAPVAAPAVVPAPVAPQMSPPVVPPPRLSPLEARKELTAMGLQYFDQSQYIAAVSRGDKLAVELFIIGGGVSIKNTEMGQSSATETRAGVGTTPFP